MASKVGGSNNKFREMSMVYVLEGKKVMVKGDPTLSKQLVEPKALLKLADAKSWILVWVLGQVEQEGNGEWTNELTGE